LEEDDAIGCSGEPAGDLKDELGIWVTLSVEYNCTGYPERRTGSIDASEKRLPAHVAGDSRTGRRACGRVIRSRQLALGLRRNTIR